MQAKMKRPAADKLRSADRGLIRSCVAAAQSHGAYEAGFPVDPIGNSDFAGSGSFWVAFEMALNRATQLRAKTSAGLQAKARLVPIVIKSGMRSADDFFASFAMGVKQFLEPLVRADENATEAVPTGDRKPALTVVRS